eukprot:CAMPEP_0114619086 /NCGR_PEP_ID=MMETSP0168-20121206/8035_1 /TAXON_ID=95228 ORGANISM="Vannella sp., Strain DIVA3 517/6/12" /NCGR_SAMPLE_ID=MMETSP0168 /ASSEMBLY_ACC=CAM_ASM_000044 /LENGTH=132 /DNA_ID=CAMNT_0001830249 /DNA_START=60 /DNA_END=454 /DNA_ORIENTATION=-
MKIDGKGLVRRGLVAVAALPQPRQPRPAVFDECQGSLSGGRGSIRSRAVGLVMPLAGGGCELAQVDLGRRAWLRRVCVESGELLLEVVEQHAHDGNVHITVLVLLLHGLLGIHFRVPLCEVSLCAADVGVGP